MKQWTGAGFPLALMLTLVALTAWLRQAVELPDDGKDGKHRHDPDYVIEGARISRLNDLGQLQHTMRAERIVHYPDDDATDVTRPYMVYFNRDRPPTTIEAVRAWVSADGAEVKLIDKVEVLRAASSTQAALQARMDRLTVYPDDERAVTDVPVEVIQGGSWIKGVGMELDNAAQLYVLKSQVTGSFEPKRKRKSGQP